MYIICAIQTQVSNRSRAIRAILWTPGTLRAELRRGEARWTPGESWGYGTWHGYHPDRNDGKIQSSSLEWEIMEYL